MRVILRQTKQAILPLEKVLLLMRRFNNTRVINHSGANILIETEAVTVVALVEKKLIEGWLISPQTDKAQVPDTRIKLNYSLTK